MKKTLIILVLILVVGGWTANKFLQRANKSSDEKERFIGETTNYKHDAEIFLAEKAAQHHDEAFAASYRMWTLSPISEFDLSAHFDEQVYYRTIGKLISEEAKDQGQADAYDALLDIGQHYGVPHEEKKPSSTTSNTPSKPTTDEEKESLLKKGKLGDKRKIPSSRRRDENR